jgi:hypothetical protein
VRRIAGVLVVVLAAPAALAGCSRNDQPRTGGVVSYTENLSFTVSFDEPLRTGHRVTWTLNVENRSKEAVTLHFRSGKDGDVALQQGGREVYRWSANRVFSQALRQVRLEAGARHAFPLEEKALPAPAGNYELVAAVASDPSPGELRRPVTVR